MKMKKHHKNPMRSFLKNWLNGGPSAESSSSSNHPSTASNHLPTPELITADNTSAEHQTQPVISETLDMSNESFTEYYTETPPYDKTTAPTIAATNSVLHEALSKMLAEVPDCKALAYVDIEKNELLGIATFQPLPEAVKPLIAAVTSDLFNAPNVIKIANLFKEHKGLNQEYNNFEGVTVHGDSDTYVFIRAQNHQNRVAVFSCRNTVPFGLILRQAKMVMPQIESLEM